MRLQIPLSKLHSGQINPRAVKATPEAHRRLVASIRAFDLLEPLVVRPMPEREDRFQVIAGNRRLAALRHIHRNSKDDPKISCEVRKVDDSTAEAISLSENFIREAMHPLDEAESFARLASDEAKGAEAIASQFGVTPRYVRQRMKLAGLAPLIKNAFRRNQIDIGTAEAFCAVPEDRQTEIWKELDGHPRGAEQVRRIIDAAWVDTSHALFDLDTLPELVVSRDLFGDRVLVERAAFIEAQSQALAKEQEALREDGWSEVVAGRREDIQDRLYSMRMPEPEFDTKTIRKLEKLDARRRKLESKRENIKDDDPAAIQAVEERIGALEQAADEVTRAAVPSFSEATKATATVFLMLDPDGQVRREYRLPRRTDAAKASEPGAEDAQPPTSNDLSDRQLAVTFIHQALAVRESLLAVPGSRKRILAMILHEKVNSESLAIHHEPNAISVNLAQDQAFKSDAADEMRSKREKLDPFFGEHWIRDLDAYQRLGKVPESRLDKLIDLLTVECLTTLLQRGTELVQRLAAELKVDIRSHWRPDETWLAGYQKLQLAQLLHELHGSKYQPMNGGRKKSELVQTLAKLFSDAADGKLEDKQLTERVNQWVPANLRTPEESPASAVGSNSK
jgi:ParB family transcriptional regulator, chromosome partitioning protein